MSINPQLAVVQFLWNKFVLQKKRLSLKQSHRVSTQQKTVYETGQHADTLTSLTQVNIVVYGNNVSVKLTSCLNESDFFLQLAIKLASCMYILAVTYVVRSFKITFQLLQISGSLLTPLSKEPGISSNKLIRKFLLT